jgi:hypothetical protein
MRKSLERIGTKWLIALLLLEVVILTLMRFSNNQVLSAYKAGLGTSMLLLGVDIRRRTTCLAVPGDFSRSMIGG